MYKPSICLGHVMTRRLVIGARVIFCVHAHIQIYMNTSIYTTCMCRRWWYVFLCAWVCVYVNICKHMHVEARGHSKLLFLSSHLPLFMRQGLSLEFGVHYQVRLASQQVLKSYLSLPLCAGIPNMCHHTWLTRMLRIRLRYSRLCSKPFTDWAILWATDDDHIYFIDMHTYCHTHTCMLHMCKRCLQQEVIILKCREMSQCRTSSSTKNGIMWVLVSSDPRPSL